MGTRVQCLNCQDVIESKHLHDFVECKCGDIFVDGGSYYLRAGQDKHASYQYVPDTGEQKVRKVLEKEEDVECE